MKLSVMADDMDRPICGAGPGRERDFDLFLFPMLVGSMFGSPERERELAAGRSWSEPFGGEAIVGERLCYIEEVMQTSVLGSCLAA